MSTFTRPAPTSRPRVAAALAARARNALDRSSISSADARREILAAGLWAALPATLAVALDRLVAGEAAWLLVPAAHQAALWHTGPAAERGIRGAAAWAVLAAGGALTAAAFGGVAAVWLTFPIVPALFLQAAYRDGGARPPERLVAGLMRTFSVAVLAAVLVQLAAGRPSPGETVAVLGGTALALAAVERLAARR